jgi:Na+/H+ antiporter NhaB
MPVHGGWDPGTKAGSFTMAIGRAIAGVWITTTIGIMIATETAIGIATIIMTTTTTIITNTLPCFCAF